MRLLNEYNGNQFTIHYTVSEGSEKVLTFSIKDLCTTLDVDPNDTKNYPQTALFESSVVPDMKTSMPYKLTSSISNLSFGEISTYFDNHKTEEYLGIVYKDTFAKLDKTDSFVYDSTGPVYKNALALPNYTPSSPNDN
jgi:hypothetical protein